MSPHDLSLFLDGILVGIALDLTVRAGALDGMLVRLERFRRRAVRGR